MTPLERITARVTKDGEPDQVRSPLPLVSVEEFFDGNDAVGSIGCNLAGQPAPSVFHALLKTIASRPDVRDIRVLVTQFDEPDWPFSDQVYVLTSATADEVRTWFPEDLAPDEVYVAEFGPQFEPYDIPAGTQPIGCWWD